MTLQSEFYRQSIKRMIKEKAGRSTAEAVEEVKEQAEQYTEKLIQQSKEMAQHADRKTIRKKDVKQAVKQGVEK